MKIICIGRNYSAHAKELGNEVPSEPLFFLKPDSAILPRRNPLYIPEWTTDLHYEVELVVKINKLGKYIKKENAHKHYDEVGVGIDFTARDIQSDLKKKGQPWEKAKAFDGSAGLGVNFLSLKKSKKSIEDVEFSLEKNGVEVQKGTASEMIFSVDEIVAYVSQFMSLKLGDLIYTGTPSGVGKVAIGDELIAKLEGEKQLRVMIK